MIQETIPTAGGDYALLLRMIERLKIQPGRLGEVEIPSGWALYFGSARGPGGLKARLARHLKPANQKRAHWHIDYLTAAAPIEEIWWRNQKSRRECRWAKIAAKIGQPVHAFGASDCCCDSHLVSFDNERHIQRVWTSLQNDCKCGLQRIMLNQEARPWPEKSPSRPAQSSLRRR